jgi:hypothetical protein
MTDRSAPGGFEQSGHVRVVTLEQARSEARALLDDYEQRYGVSSERRHEAFTGADGTVQETGDYLLWTTTWERWQELTTQQAS